MTENEALRVVGHLLERHATDGAYARTVDGDWVDVGDPRACCWCLEGACAVVGGLPGAPGALGVERAAMRRLRYRASGALIRHWDRAGAAKRARIIARLKTAGLEAR